MGISLTFDQYKNDQVLQILVQEQSGKRSYGFYVNDQNAAHIEDTTALVKAHEEEKDEVKKQEILQKLQAASVNRMYMGKFSDGPVGLAIRDKTGKTRISAGVDANDVPYIVGSTFMRSAEEEN